MRDKGHHVLAENWPTPAKIIGELLKRHSEAASLLAEASHRQALAAWSAVNSETKFGVAQAARLAYEELRHRLDPRRGRPVHFDMGLLVLAVVGAGLAMLDLFELSGLPDGPGSALLALAATAVWVTVAWLAAVAGRRRHWASLSAIIGAAIALGLLLVALHGFTPHPDWSTFGGRSLGGGVLGALAAAFILVLAASAADLIAHMEPASLLAARRGWHRARSDYEKAVRIQQDDLEAAAVATEAWLGLVRAWVTTVARGDEQLVGETMAWAIALAESGRPKLSPAE